MSVVRRVNRPADQFTMIRNSFHRDSRLSLKARGLGGWLLSHVDGWETNVSAIAKAVGAGREQVRTALLELEQCGYLRRVQERDERGRLGEAVYLVQCEPFEDETAGQDRDPETRPRTSGHRVATHHKKTSSQKITSKETNPSGGVGSAAPPPSASTVEEHPVTEEDDMPKTDPAQAPLFEVPSPEPPAAEARKAAGAQAVIAAYVEAWREINSGAEPLRATKGRIARDAKAMLAKSEATETELVQAARAMASGPWSNIAQQIIIQRRARGRGTPLGHSVPLPQEHPSWSQGAAQEAARRAEAPLTEEEQAYLREYVQAGVA